MPAEPACGPGDIARHRAAENYLDLMRQPVAMSNLAHSVNSASVQCRSSESRITNKISVTPCNTTRQRMRILER